MSPQTQPAADGSPYDEVIMEHIRNARNYRAPGPSARALRGVNPMCGDDLTVYVQIESGVIVDAAFQCACCGVSMASASILTEFIVGLRAAEAKTRLGDFIAGIEAGALPDGAGAAPLALLDTTRRFPARKRCAMLPWLTLDAALEGRDEPVYVR